MRGMWRHRGMTLIQAITMIALLGTVIPIGSQMLLAMMAMSQEAQVRQTLVAQQAYLVQRLRADVWGCSGIRVMDGKTAELQLPGEYAVRWIATGEGEMTREMVTGGEVSRREVFAGATEAWMEQEGETLVVQMREPRARRTETWRATSELMRLRESLP